MVKAQDLRVGNWVMSVIEGIGQLPVRVEPSILMIFTGEVKSPNMMSFKPIPLSEEILLKCGFINSGLYYFKDQVYINLLGIQKPDFIYKYNYAHAEIKYLHQLQNLYFALTGKELNVEL